MRWRRTPGKLAKAIIILVYNKGNIKDCESCRGIN
jgi:hypothetical protein